jgi:hypothetical protein
VYQLSCPTRKSHSTSASFRRWLDLALNWLFEGIYLKKHHRSAVDLARQDARRAKDGCVLWAAKKPVTYVNPTLILSFHTIEYFVPFLGTKLFHNILNYQSHNHAVLNPCRDGCLANTDQCSGQYLQYRPKCVYRYACHDNIITTGSIKTPVKN